MRDDIRHCGRCQRGFTLIEVLVVVAIIALLIAVLFPSLTRARAVSQSTVCLHHLSQLGLGAMQYSHMHRDYIPPLDPAKIDIGPSSSTYYNLGGDNMGVYYPKYAPNLHGFECPGAHNTVEPGDANNNGFVDDLENSYVRGTTRKGMAFEYIPFLYYVKVNPAVGPGESTPSRWRFNYADPPHDKTWPLRVGKTKKASEVCIIHDADNPGQNLVIDDPEDPHVLLRGGNMVFADGHANFVRAKYWLEWSDRGRPLAPTQ